MKNFLPIAFFVSFVTMLIFAVVAILSALGSLFGFWDFLWSSLYGFVFLFMANGLVNIVWHLARRKK